MVLFMAFQFAGSVGCAFNHVAADNHPAPARPMVVVVAPVLNLSNSTDWDPWRVTDMVAAELQSFPNVSVIPTNRTLAGLSRMGKSGVETPLDALDLAAEFGADATVVTALTEYEPYDPPRVGLVMQWYLREQPEPTGRLDPVGASRQASDVGLASSEDWNRVAPLLQIQRVYDASNKQVLKDVRSYNKRRFGHESPYGWRVHLKSQELFVRYCCWETIRSMLLEREQRLVVPEHGETKRWTDKDDA